MIKWPGGVHNPCNMLRNGTIPPCKKVVAERSNPVLVILMGDPGCHWLPFPVVAETDDQNSSENFL